MSARYDSEDLLESILAIMVSGGALNAQLNAIEAEKVANGKGLDPAPKEFADESYHVQTWSDKILQRNPAIFYGIEDVETKDGGGGATADTYKIFVECVLVDDGMRADGWKRIARYSRALKELFAANYSPAIAQGVVKIETVRPIAFKLALDSDDEVKVGGISLTVTLF